jgi:hypothetical protein
MLKVKVNVCQDFITFDKQMQMGGNSYAVHQTHHLTFETSLINGCNKLR